MRHTLLLLIGIMSSAWQETKPGRNSSVLSQLATVAKAKWDEPGLRADFDCDGRMDVAHLGHRPKQVLVGVVRAAGGKPHVLEFAISASIQDAICSEPARLESEDLAGGPPDDLGPIPGYPTGTGCKGLVLSGGECDSVHVFWNTETKRFDWWRR